jgi:hypothetical protein
MKMLKLLVVSALLSVLAGCAGFTPKSDPSLQYTYGGVPNTMADHWVGAAYEDGGKENWTFAMDLRQKELSLVNYFSQNCSAIMKYQRTEPNGGLLFLEQKGSGSQCFGNHYVRLTQTEPNTVEYAFYTIEGEKKASGQLKRSSTTAFHINLDQRLIGTWTGTAVLVNGKSTPTVVTIGKTQTSSASYEACGQSRLYYRSFINRSVAFEEQAGNGQPSSCVGQITTFNYMPDGTLRRINLNSNGERVSATYLSKVK